MGYCRQTALPAKEPVSLAEAKSFLRVNASFQDDDATVLALIQAAREYAEAVTGRALAQRTFRMVLDSMPYFTDAAQSQLAYPPSYYSLPRYSTTMWNYSQMIKLPFAPCVSVEAMRYIGSDGAAHTMLQDTDFVLDRQSEPARIFPMTGQYWPANLYVANSCEIDFTAGYDPNPMAAVDTHEVTADPPNQQPDSTIVPGVPQTIRLAMLLLIGAWYDNRWAVTKDNLREVPLGVCSLLQSNAVVDFQPTRG